MLKKLLSFLVILTVITLLISEIELTKTNNINAWNTMGNDGSSLIISIHDEKNKIYENIVYLSKKYNANFMKNTTIWDSEGEYTFIKSIYLNHDFEYNLPLLSGKMLTYQDNDTLQYISTNNNDNHNQVGQLNIPLSDPTLEIWTLKKLLNENQVLDGTYYVQLGNFQDQDAFIAECCQLFSMDQAELLNNSNTSLNISSFNIFKVLNIILCILIDITIIYYTVNSLKKIFILKIHGYSLLKIYWQFNRFYLLFELGSILLAIVFAKFLLTNPNTVFMKGLIQKYVMLFFITLAGSSLFYILSSSLEINQFIKGKNFNNVIVKFNYLFKIIALAGIAILLSFSLANLNQSMQMIKKRKNWVPYENYAVLDYYDMRDYTSSSTDTEIEALKEYYHILTDKGAIYTSYDQQNNIMKVNTNYLNYIGIDIENIKNTNENNRIFLTPDSLKQEAEKIIIKSQKEKQEEKSFTLYFYDNSNINDIFTLDTRTNSSFTNQVIFDVITINNIDKWELLNMTSTGINSSLKIPLHSISLDEVNSLANRYLSDTLGKPTYHTIEYIFSNEDQINKDLFEATLPMLWIVVIIYIFINIQTMQIFVMTNIKSLMLKRLHGYSFDKRYSSFIKIQIIIDSAILLLFITTSIIFMLNTSNNLYIQIKPQYSLLLCGVLLVIIDGIFIFYKMRKIESKSIIQFIKGENYGNH